MTDAAFTFYEGRLPLLISVPHDGRALPSEVQSKMTPVARRLPDTDWHVAELYAFCRSMGANMIVAEYSRYVVDLNRSGRDEALYPGQVSTGVCPAKTFGGEDIYLDGQAVSAAERDARVEKYWRPYHEKIETCLRNLIKGHGYALLWDAHSIASVVPRLFEGQLPALNLGTNGGASCPVSVESAVADVAARSGLSHVVNGRFRGGYITRHYGRPAERCYAIQLELSQRCYMDEGSLRYDPERAVTMIKILRSLLETFVDTAAQTNGVRNEKKDRNS